MLVLKYCDAKRAGHMSGGAAVQERPDLTEVRWWAVAGWPGSVAGRTPVSQSWDAAVCTAPAYN